MDCIARQVTEYNFPCCVFVSVACAFYSNFRAGNTDKHIFRGWRIRITTTICGLLAET